MRINVESRAPRGRGSCSEPDPPQASRGRVTLRELSDAHRSSRSAAAVRRCETALSQREWSRCLASARDAVAQLPFNGTARRFRPGRTDPLLRPPRVHPKCTRSGASRLGPNSTTATKAEALLELGALRRHQDHTTPAVRPLFYPIIETVSQRQSFAGNAVRTRPPSAAPRRSLQRDQCDEFCAHQTLKPSWEEKESTENGAR